MILILNGVPNAGKTTVAKCLTSLLPKLAHLEIDKITDMNHSSLGVFLDNSGETPEENAKRILSYIPLAI